MKAPEFDQKDLNEVFEESAKKGKVVSAIILHPEAMAYVSATCMGTLIIDDNKGSYTSDIFANPEYTDVYSAFTENNTICDKVTSFVERGQRCIDDIIAERNADVIQPLNDEELSAIQEFERVKHASSISNISKVKDYFNSNGNNSINLEDGLEYSGFTAGNLGFIHQF